MTDEAAATGRGVVEVQGPEARALLQRLITNDVETLAAGEARYAALLTPQGKIMVDFLVVAAPTAEEPERFLLDCPAGLAADLARRLTLYRLRAKLTVVDRSTEWTAVPLPDAAAKSVTGVVTYRDPRHPALGSRAIGPIADVAAMAASVVFDRDRRIAAAVPEGGTDFPFGDTFPHEANLDRLAGVDFTKGCYVGQEVVSRMQHRATTRKRVTPVSFAMPPTAGAEVRAGDLPVGMIGSIGGTRGLALLRLDRVADAQAAGTPLMAGDRSIQAEPT